MVTVLGNKKTQRPCMVLTTNSYPTAAQLVRFNSANTDAYLLFVIRMEIISTHY